MSGDGSDIPDVPRQKNTLPVPTRTLTKRQTDPAVPTLHSIAQLIQHTLPRCSPADWPSPGRLLPDRSPDCSPPSTPAREHSGEPVSQKSQSTHTSTKSTPRRTTRRWSVLFPSPHPHPHPTPPPPPPPLGIMTADYDQNGGYVNPPREKRQFRDPYADWWDKQGRRNFGEPVCPLLYLLY